MQNFCMNLVKAVRLHTLYCRRFHFFHSLFWLSSSSGVFFRNLTSRLFRISCLFECSTTVCMLLKSSLQKTSKKSEMVEHVLFHQISLFTKTSFFFWKNESRLISTWWQVQAGKENCKSNYLSHWCQQQQDYDASQESCLEHSKSAIHFLRLSV